MEKESSYETLLTFLKEPKPREVPDQFIYSNPIAGLFVVLGGILTTMLLCMSVLFVILHAKGFMGQTTSSYVLFLPAIMSVIPLFLLLYGLLNRNKSTKYLSNGDLAKGLVQSVKPVGARINSRTFFEVKVKYNSASNNNLVASDIVDNWSMEYFLEARDSKKMVDVLFLPHITKKVLLVHKIVTIKQFD